MEEILSVNQIDLTPTRDKSYWNCDRDWREEFIYHVLVDRFHDDVERHPVNHSNRSKGGGNLTELRTFCGGTLKGITSHLDYIQGLGCTAIWLSPLFENNPDAYHGYAVQNFLDIDPHFGRKEDLVDLVDAAHKRGMRIFLDIVLNHSGDNWDYEDDLSPKYFLRKKYNFGRWKMPNRPVPIELRNPDYYNRMGQIQNWEDSTESQYGDISNFKDFRNDDSQQGLEVQDILLKVYCYWIKETDIDGFRLDAVKHIHPLTVARFCTRIREYTKLLGKHQFFIFGEVALWEESQCDPYLTAICSEENGSKEIFFGLDAVLDFFLEFSLLNFAKGTESPRKILQRYERLHRNLMERGKLGNYLVTFIDNHDQLYSLESKQRFAADASDKQVIAAIGFILCAIGIPCIYYGTEQGFSGKSDTKDYADSSIRETMFSLNVSDINFLNRNCDIYKEISKIAQIRKSNKTLSFGRMKFRKISEDGKNYSMPDSQQDMLSFSRILFETEVLIMYNSSTERQREIFVELDNGFFIPGKELFCLYGKHKHLVVRNTENSSISHSFVNLKIDPLEFLIFSS
jgi:glycosidase